MAATQLGTALEAGVGTTLTDYIIVSIQTGGGDVHMEDIRDEDGKLATRIIMQKMAKIKLELIAKDGADPETDFPEKDIATASGYTNYFVDSCTVSRTEGATKVSVDLIDIGITGSGS